MTACVACKPADSGSSDGDTDSETAAACELPVSYSYELSDTNLLECYDTTGSEIDCPSPGEDYYGQDAQYPGTAADYSVVCDDEVVIDENTGLSWERAHHDTRVSYQTAAQYCADLTLGGETDWRVPSIKELLSISDWSGSQHIDGAFYIDGTRFDFDYPDIDDDDLTGSHSNQMMGQTWS
ncbi:MAG: DUF1566 domain-containing protein, partial [bacterium]|nr:DUF1566 domain-containing protein [bacterium]